MGQTLGLALADSSVVVAFLDAGDAHNQSARSALERAAAQGLVVSVITYSEVMVGAFRVGSSTVRSFEQFFRELPRQIEPVSRSIGERAARLRAKHRWLHLPDALILATAEELTVERTYTADARWSRISERVEVI